MSDAKLNDLWEETYDIKEELKKLNYNLCFLVDIISEHTDIIQPHHTPKLERN